MEMGDAAVLDLFAGTGALGLEAASRGARSVCLVDNHAGAASVVKANIQLVAKALTHAPTLQASTTSVASFLSSTAPGDISVAFLDPPYDYSSGAVDDHLLALRSWLADDAIVIVERSSKGTPPQFPDGYEELTPKTYGDTTVYWARFLKGSQPPL
jgi:16S rRNA (guanine966-N2)-methyltransferase